jgi:hypothetical protein
VDQRRWQPIFAPAATQTESDVITIVHQTLPHLTNATLAHILKLYPSSDFMPGPAENVTAQFARLPRMARDIEFICPALFFAAHTASFHPKIESEPIYHTSSKSQGAIFQRIFGSLLPTEGRRSAPPGPFVYQLQQTVLQGFFTAAGITQAGVSHESDIPYVFDNLKAQFNPLPSDVLLAKQVLTSWSRFARFRFPSSAKGTSIKNWIPAEVGQYRCFGESGGYGDWGWEAGNEWSWREE